ncbi:hypothetical protein M434DRAFT_394377 [Hypoxylon sp. CO27-5]|nr:hypothetical protein M434DRAFT_394377 [Hypoxylon sp. CO27-5]
MGPSRGAYNFNNYDSRLIMRPNKDTKKTVEFRQAAGSLDGRWVSTYAKICVGIGRFAEVAAEGRMWRLIYDCHCADVGKAEYDVLDLLLDLGLTEEAEIVQYRLEMDSHVAETLRVFSSKTVSYGMD